MSRRTLSLMILILALLILPNILNKTSLKPVVEKVGTYKVIEVFDGDTISVNYDGVTEKVRLIGIDTPETHKPDTPPQCYGKEASDFLKNRIEGKYVKLEADPKSTPRDRYSRLLRYVYYEDVFINAEIVEKGYGFAYTSFPYTKLPEILDLEKKAKADNIGIWTNCNAELKKGRYQSPSI
jgi:micrococcal nuclease